MLAAVLRRYPLFALLGTARLEAWAAAGQELDFNCGETIIQEGTPGVWAYLVLHGYIRAVRTAGREIPLGSFGPGEVFGEYALLAPGNNLATCRPIVDSRVLRLPLSYLHAQLQSLPQVTERLKNWLRLHALVSYLRGQCFLGFMTAPSGLKWLDRLRETSFEPSQAIQADGLADDCWFYLADGEVDLHQSAATDGADAQRINSGDCFGEAGLLGTGRPLLAVAHTQAKCHYLTRSDFESRANSSTESFQQTIILTPVSGRLPWIGQQGDADCGLAALAMAARYLGAEIELERLRAEVSLSSRGMSLGDLKRVAADRGFPAYAVRIVSSQYVQITPPAVVHYCNGHYVTLYEYGIAGVVVGDPATGVIRMSRQSFHQASSGCLLLLRPPDQPHRLPA